MIAEASPANFASLKKALSPPAEAPALQPAPLPKAPVEEVAPAPAPAPVTPTADPAFVWLSLIQEIQTQRPLITSWVKLGRPIAMENGSLRVGFPRGQKMVVESLGKANNRKFLEGLLARFAGAPVSLRLELEDRDEEPEDASGPPSVPGVISLADHAPQFSVVKTEDPVEAFRNDPLIRKALKVFEGEIRSVEGSTSPNL